MAKTKRSPAGLARQQAYIREWQQKNRERIAVRQKALRQALRLEALVAYGGVPPQCRCCGSQYIEHLTVAAMEGDILWGTTGQTGTALYRKLHNENYPAGYRVLCWSCLMARALYDACPHEAEVGSSESPVLHSVT